MTPTNTTSWDRQVLLSQSHRSHVDILHSDILHYGSTWNPYQIIPPYDQRTPITWTMIPQMLIYWAPFYLLAYLARRADTHLLRLLVLPIVLTTATYCTYWFKVEQPELATVEWGRSESSPRGFFLSVSSRSGTAFLSIVVVGKALDFAFAKNGKLKVTEQELPPIGSFTKAKGASGRANGVANGKANGEANGHAHSPNPRTAIFPQWFRDASDIIFTMRGIGWDFGKGLYVPKESRSLERGPFLRTTALSLLYNYIVIDVLNTFFKLVPRVGTYRGGSIFLPELAPLPRYVLSSAIHLATGFIVQYGMDICNDIATLFGVGVLGQDPTAWPPVQDRAWKATSLHDYWGKRWHQTLRQVFLVFGGRVCAGLAGPVGTVFGTFFASGMYHELGMHMSDHRVTLFFLLQGVGIVLEGFWKKATGRNVGGVVGWIWTAFFVLVIGQISSASLLRPFYALCVLMIVAHSGCMGYPRSHWRADNTVPAQRDKAVPAPCCTTPTASFAIMIDIPTSARSTYDIYTPHCYTSHLQYTVSIRCFAIVCLQDGIKRMLANTITIYIGPAEGPLPFIQ